MNRVDEGVLQVGWQISCRQEWQECEVAGTNRYKIATWKFYYCLKWSCYLRKIFVNPCEFLGLCWVVFRSRNFADAKRKEVVCTTLGFFPNSASGNGIWALGSGISKKKWAGKWDWYLPFRARLKVTFLSAKHFSDLDNQDCLNFCADQKKNPK